MKHPLNPTSRNEGLANAVVDRIDQDRAEFATWWLKRAPGAMRLASDDLASALRMVAWEAFRRGSMHASEERDKLHSRAAGMIAARRELSEVNA